MINKKEGVLGIIFPNTYDSLMPELTNDRSMASIPFASRYRMIDFVLSGMANAGINNVSILVKENYLSLIDHLESGKEWDLTRKHGGLNIVPPFAQKTIKRFAGRIDGLSSIYNFLNRQSEKYVVISDANIAFNFDFKELIDEHIKNEADITVAYAKYVLPPSEKIFALPDKDRYFTLGLDGNRVTDMRINPDPTGAECNLSLNVYVIERERLINLVSDAYVNGSVHFEEEVIIKQLDRLKVMAYEYTGYLARLTNLKSYFEESMKLLDSENLTALFKGDAIYTKNRDDNPTRYIGDANAKNVMVADGCVIEGEIENSILFRGVKIAKGAKVKNCILMQDTVVGENAEIEYVVTDKIVEVSAGKKLSGTASFPVYVAKGKIV